MTFLSRILITLINIPISMLVARKLGVEGQGAYAAVVAVASLWTSLFLLGVDAAHTYSLASRRATFAEVLTNTLWWSLGLGLVATPLYLAVAPLMKPDDSGALAGALTLSAAAVPLGLLKYFALSLFLGEGRIERFNLIQVVSNLALLGLLLILLVWAPGGVHEAVLAYVASLLVFVLIAAVWITRRAREHGGFRLQTNRPLFRSGLIYGLKGHLGTLVVQLTYRSDQVLVTRLIGLEAQGFYSIAVLLAEKLAHIPNSVQLVLFPRISASQGEDANRLTPVVTRFTLWLVSAAAVLLALFGELLIRLLYEARFLPALPSFYVLLPGIVLLSIGKLLAGDLSGRDRRWGPTIAMSLGFLLNLGLNLLWIPRYGIVGAAWASTLAYGFQSFVLAGIFWKVSGVSPVALLWPRREDWALAKQAARRIRRREP